MYDHILSMQLLLGLGPGVCAEKSSHDGHQSQGEDLTQKTEGAGHDHLEGEEREGTDSGIKGDHSEGDGD